MAASRVKTRFKRPRPRYFFREWRKHRGLTQEELAEAIGVTSSSISQLETGKQGFTGETLEAIASALYCEPSDLLSFNPLDGEGIGGVVHELRNASEPERSKAIRILRELLRTNETAA